jgi:hypothetical protein
LRKKLDALGVVVFYRENNVWRLGNFQAELPGAEAEVHFQYMLTAGFPDELIKHKDGLCFGMAEQAQKFFPKLSGFFADKTLLAARTNYAGLPGVRIAWRDESSPYTAADLNVLRCFADCPKDCKPGICTTS